MTQRAVLELQLGDRLSLRRAHPCGSRDWIVVRLGADIGIACLGCGRRVLLERAQLERRVVRLLRGEALNARIPAGSRRHPGAAT